MTLALIEADSCESSVIFTSIYIFAKFEAAIIGAGLVAVEYSSAVVHDSRGQLKLDKVYMALVIFSPAKSPQTRWPIALYSTTSKSKVHALVTSYAGLNSDRRCNRVRLDQGYVRAASVGVPSETILRRVYFFFLIKSEERRRQGLEQRFTRNCFNLVRREPAGNANVFVEQIQQR